MENKIIVFANMKGGVGKSVLCTLFANDLASKGQPVAVVDADLQQTIYQQRQREMKAAGLKDEDTPWDVTWLDTRNGEGVIDLMERIKQFEGYVLIDAPGNLSDDNLAPIYLAADYLVVPTSFHQNVIASTEIFADTIMKVNKAGGHSKMFFVPNNIDTRVGTKEEILAQRRNADVLSRYGKLTARINRRASVMRASTVEYDYFQEKAIHYAFADIYNGIK